MPTKKEVEIPGYLKISKVVVWFLYFYILLGIISLLLRVFLLLFSANPNAGFAELVGDISGEYLQPFRGIFPPKEIGETGYLDVSALFAILVYLIVLWGVHATISYVQNKIDMSRAEQEREIAEAKRQRELEAEREREDRRAARAKASTQTKKRS